MLREPIINTTLIGGAHQMTVTTFKTLTASPAVVANRDAVLAQEIGNNAMRDSESLTDGSHGQPRLVQGANLGKGIGMGFCKGTSLRTRQPELVEPVGDCSEVNTISVGDLLISHALLVNHAIQLCLCWWRSSKASLEPVARSAPLDSVHFKPLENKSIADAQACPDLVCRKALCAIKVTQKRLYRRLETRLRARWRRCDKDKAIIAEPLAHRLRLDSVARRDLGRGEFLHFVEVAQGPSVGAGGCSTRAICSSRLARCRLGRAVPAPVQRTGMGAEVAAIRLRTLKDASTRLAGDGEPGALVDTGTRRSAAYDTGFGSRDSRGRDAELGRTNGANQVNRHRGSVAQMCAFGKYLEFVKMRTMQAANDD